MKGFIKVTRTQNNGTGKVNGLIKNEFQI